jgi:hypothetical protein
MNSRNPILQSLKITSQEEVQVIEDTVHEKIHTMAPLLVEGGVSVGKGIKIGIQENLVGGMMVYDGENFLGFSEKFGLTLLSNHHQSTYLEIPLSIFQKKILPTTSSETKDDRKFQELDGIKKMNMALEIKDISTFYIRIPEIYGTSTFQLFFQIELFFEENHFVSEIQLYIINESKKNISFDFQNKMKIFYQKEFLKSLEGFQIRQIKIHRVSPQHLFISFIDFENFM